MLFCVWFPAPCDVLEVHRAVVGFSGLFLSLVEWWSVVCTLASVYPGLLRGDLGTSVSPSVEWGGFLTT